MLAPYLVHFQGKRLLDFLGIADMVKEWKKEHNYLSEHLMPDQQDRVMEWMKEHFQAIPWDFEYDFYHGNLFDKENLRTLCKECHKAKSKLDNEFFSK